MEAIDFGTLVARLVLGGVILVHGINKIAGDGGIRGTERWFGALGMRRPALQARLAAGTELVAGAALISGVLTALACAAVVGLMTVAIVTVHGRNGFFIFRTGGGWEYCFVLAAVAFVVAVIGPGSASVDAAVNASTSPSVGGAIALGGALVAAIHLGLTYRPPSGSGA